MYKFPMNFSATSSSRSGIQTPWVSSAAGFQSQVAIPEAFEGSGKGLSPEDLLAQAMLNCFFATFKVFAEKSRLDFSSIDGNAALTLNREQKSPPRITHIQLNIRLSGASDPSKAERILQKTKSNCLIINAVQIDKSFEFDVAG